MSDYIVEAIKNGVFETLKMTAYASLYAYIVGLPLGVILYATASGRIARYVFHHRREIAQNGRKARKRALKMRALTEM